MSVLCPCCRVHPDDCLIMADFKARFERELAADRGAVAGTTPRPEVPSFRIHHLKTWPAPFRAVLAGHKRHEVRRDDRGFELGDVLYLVEYDPSPMPYPLQHRIIGETGRRLRVRVTYISRGVHGLPPDLVVMSVQPESLPDGGSAFTIGEPPRGTERT